jgi:flagellar protein FlaG
MTSTVPITSIASDPTVVPPPTPSTKTSLQSQTPHGALNTPADGSGADVETTPLDEQADLRLVIEEDGTAGTYVYKTVDPRTGKVVAQLPREELLRLRESSGYAPGAVVDARS